MRAVLASAALLLLTGLVTSCSKAPPAVEPGVSLELAKHRAETISDIDYALSLTIPESPDEEIEGRAGICLAAGSDIAVPCYSLFS